MPAVLQNRWLAFLSHTLTLWCIIDINLIFYIKFMIYGQEILMWSSVLTMILCFFILMLKGILALARSLFAFIQHRKDEIILLVYYERNIRGRIGIQNL
jgi:hypothetical protein